MPYDPVLADRIRALLADAEGLTEKKMFGGVGFMIGGHMACGAHNDGNLMIHCDKQTSRAWAEEPGAGLMQRGGKGMAGWIIVDRATVAGDDALSRWVARGREWASAQPPK